MRHRDARFLLTTVSLIAATVGVAGLVSAQLKPPTATTTSTTTLTTPPTSPVLRVWSVSPQFPAMIADAANGTRVAMAFGNATVTRQGVFFGVGGEIGVRTEASTSQTPPLAAGDYRITVKIINAQLPNTLKAFRTTDHADVPNPALGTLISSCDVPATPAVNKTVSECNFTLRVSQPGHIYTFVTTSNPAQFSGLTFTRL